MVEKRTIVGDVWMIRNHDSREGSMSRRPSLRLDSRRTADRPEPRGHSMLACVVGGGLVQWVRLVVTVNSL